MLITICWCLVFYRCFPQTYSFWLCFYRCWQFARRSTGVLLTGAQWGEWRGTGVGDGSAEMHITKVCFWIIIGFSTGFSTACVNNFWLCSNVLYRFSTISIRFALLGRMCRTCRPVAHLQDYAVCRQEGRVALCAAVGGVCCQQFIYIILIISLKKRINDEYDVAFICGKLPSCEPCFCTDEEVFNRFMHHFY